MPASLGKFDHIRQWGRCVSTTLSCRIDAENELQLNVVKESLNTTITLSAYCDICLIEIEQNMENYDCLEREEYQLVSGISGVQSVCRWMPLGTETYYQIFCFTINQGHACRLFVSLSENQWLEYGEALRGYLKSLEFWKL